MIDTKEKEHQKVLTKEKNDAQIIQLAKFSLI